MRRRFGIGVLLLMVAAETAWASNPATKLGRGASNLAFGFMEIFHSVAQQSDEHGFAIGVPAGLVEGAALTFARALAGAYESVTFLLPNGRRGYDAILLPESVFTKR